MNDLKRHPPRFFLRFFNWFCDPDLKPYIEGDLIELYNARFRRSGKRKADLLFMIDVLLLFRPGIIRPVSHNNHINQFAMFKSYFKTGWRNLARQKMYSLLKIGGFSMGIAACFLIALLIRDELSYDNMYPDADRIFRVVGSYSDEGAVRRGVHFQPPFAKALTDDFPEIEKAGRYNNVELFGAANAAIRRSDRLENIYEENLAYFDQDLLDILAFPLMTGNPQKALASPYSIVISRKKAAKYFPAEDPVGKTLIINDDNERPYTITGVLDDISGKSHLGFDFLLSLEGKEFWPGEQTNWCCSNYPTYVRVREGVNISALESKLTETVLAKYVIPGLIADGHPNPEEMAEKLWLELQPIADVHLYSHGIHDDLSHGDIRFVWMFAAVATVVLIIACINFINLSTARSANRAREVGLRKVVGSYRSDLVRQFMVESMLFSLLSFIMGIALASALLPWFNQMAGTGLVIPWLEWWLVPVIVASSFTVGLAAGLYPSLYLSSFRPIQVLKGSLQLGSRSSAMRAVLVVFQFTVSIVLIVGTVVIYRQMQFVLNTKLGFNKDNVMVIQGTHMLGDQLTVFKDKMKQLPHVTSVSVSDYLPVRGTKRNGNQFFVEGRKGTDKPVQGQFWVADEDYLTVMEMKLVQGRNFNPDLGSDKEAVIINERMARELGLSSPLGAQITNRRVYTVIGVVEDFHFESFKDNIRPLAIGYGMSPTIVSARLDHRSASDVIEDVTALWKEMAPNQPLRYTFLNQSYARMYESVTRMSQVFTSCAVFAVVVACLGLFGLSAFMTEQRRKEISIRLVLGASVRHVLRLVMQNFILLIIVAFLIAGPIAWFVMQRWLEDYVYRIDITWDVFALAGGLSLLVAITTISYQSVRAALVNPVQNLRSD
jgi:putative ABC transport system permease protein